MQAQDKLGSDYFCQKGYVNNIQCSHILDFRDWSIYK